MNESKNKGLSAAAAEIYRNEILRRIDAAWAGARDAMSGSEQRDNYIGRAEALKDDALALFDAALAAEPDRCLCCGAELTGEFRIDVDHNCGIEAIQRRANERAASPESFEEMSDRLHITVEQARELDAQGVANG